LNFRFARLPQSALSDEENQRVFGLAANPNGHGHNYLLESAWKASPTL